MADTSGDAVDWDALVARHGEPLLLKEFRTVCGDDEVAADDALEAIADATIHQYTRFEHSPECVPFIVGILSTPGAAVRWRSDLLRILTAIAIGSDQGDVPGGAEPARMRETLAEIPEEFRGVGEERYVMERLRSGGDRSAVGRIRVYWAIASYLAVDEAVPELLALLEDPDEQVRAYVAYLLGWFPERAALIVPALRAAGERPEATPLTTAVMTLAFAMVAGDFCEGRDLARITTLSGGWDELTSWAAAVALARLRGVETPANVVARLIEVVSGEPEALDGTGLPFISGNPVGVTAAALGMTDTEPSGEIVDAMCVGLLRADADGAYELIGILLAAVFPDGPVPAETAYADLTARQRRVVAAAGLAAGAWEPGNFSEELAAWGLISERSVWASDEATPGGEVRMELLAYAELDAWEVDHLGATAAIPGEEPAEILIEAVPEPLKARVRDALWEVVPTAFDESHLDVYVDEASYRGAADRWLSATERHLREVFPPMDLQVERTGPLLLTVRFYPFAAVQSPQRVGLKGEPEST